MNTNYDLKDRRLSTNYEKAKYKPLTSQNTFISQAAQLEPAAKMIGSAKLSNNVSPFKRQTN